MKSKVIIIILAFITFMCLFVISRLTKENAMLHSDLIDYQTKVEDSELRIIESEEIINDLQLSNRDLEEETKNQITESSIANETIELYKDYIEEYHPLFETFFFDNMQDEIIDNPIDKEFERRGEELVSATNIEYSDLYYEFTTIWEEELDKTYEELLKAIEDRYKEDFISSHAMWKQSYSDNKWITDELILNKHIEEGYPTWTIVEGEAFRYNEIRRQCQLYKEIYYIITGELEYFTSFR